VPAIRFKWICGREQNRMTTANRTSHQQIIKKAESELVVLDKTERETVASITRIDAEIETITARMTARSTELTTLFETASSLQAQHESLATQERLAVGTLAEGNLAGQGKAAEREAQKAKKALEQMEARVQKEDNTDHHRLQALTAEKGSCTRRLGDIANQRQTLSQAKAAAHEAMGLDECRDIEFQVDILNRQLEARRAAVRQAEQELDDFAVEALQRLIQWPDLQQQVKPSLPYHDATTRILEAAATLYGLLLTEGPRAKVDLDTLRQVHRWASNLSDLLWLEQRDLWPVLPSGHIDEARTIRERKTQLEQLLELYRQEKR
jgi:chromosome segregation ATPase